MKKTNLKRFLLLFCMLACVFSMTACGNAQIDTNTAKESVKDNEVALVENYLKDWAKDMILYLNSNQGEAGTDALIADAEAGKTLNDANNKMYIVNQAGMNVKTIGLYNSWNSTKDELGKLDQDINVNDIDVKVSDETSELCTISAKLKFEKRECTFEFVINTDYTLESGAINPSYTTGEKMGKAGMNTLIGMGTVFVVLIFISFIISLFKYINKFENRKKEQKEDTASVGVDNAIAQIVSNEEENVEDDLELIAVITAAIAASEGTSTDGLVVRSIRKVNNRRK